VSPTEPQKKEVPLQLSIVVRSLVEEKEILASQSHINNNIDNNTNSERTSRRLEALGKYSQGIISLNKNSNNK